MYLTNKECKLERLSVSKSFNKLIIMNLLEDLVCNMSIEYLDISFNEIGTEISELLCELIRKNKALRELKIDGNHLDTECWIGLRVEIDKSISMKHLDSPHLDFQKICTKARNIENYKNAVNSVFSILKKHPPFDGHLFNIENDQVDGKYIFIMKLGTSLKVFI